MKDEEEDGKETDELVMCWVVGAAWLWFVSAGGVLGWFPLAVAGVPAKGKGLLVKLALTALVEASGETGREEAEEAAYMIAEREESESKETGAEIEAGVMV